MACPKRDLDTLFQYIKFEPAHEIMAFFVLRNFILQTRMRNRLVEARCLIFGRTLRLLPYFMCANSEGSGETALVAYVISTIISCAGSSPYINPSLHYNTSKLFGINKLIFAFAYKPPTPYLSMLVIQITN